VASLSTWKYEIICISSDDEDNKIYCIS
jgi:hypothetical protein